MDPRTISTLFGLLAVLTLAGTLLVLLALVRPLPAVSDLVRAHGLGAAAAVTGVATLGSLYYSLVLGYPPCSLCWVQRAFMYPTAVVLLVALVRAVRAGRALDWPPGHVPDPGVWRHVAPLAAVGLPVSLWHVGIERMPVLGTGTCAADNPCSAMWVEVFGVLTLPTMAAIGFGFVLATAGLVSRHSRAHERTTSHTPAAHRGP